MLQLAPKYRTLKDAPDCRCADLDAGLERPAVHRLRQGDAQTTVRLQLFRVVGVAQGKLGPQAPDDGRVLQAGEFALCGRVPKRDVISSRRNQPTIW